MPRLVKRPESVRRQLPAGGEEGRFAHGVLKGRERLARVAGHEKAKAVELRQAFGKIVGSFFFQALSCRPRPSGARNSPFPNPALAR